MPTLHVPEIILQRAINAMTFYFQTKKVYLLEEEKRQISVAWRSGIDITLELGRYEVEIIPPRKSGDDVVRLHRCGEVVGKATKHINTIIYAATELNWYAEEDNRATL